MADTGGSGNGPQRPNQSRIAAGANTPMAKTGALVVLALIIGIVMINIVGDDGGTAKTAVSTATTTPSSSTTGSTTATTAGTGKTTTTTAKTRAVVPPASLRVIVVNSGSPTGSGGNVSNALKSRGYTNQVPTTKVTWKQAGLLVHCKPGFEREGTALVKALTGIPNYTAKAAAWKQQPGIPADVHCYVSIGAAS